MTRTGKIARLPRHIRDELNRRLDEGEEGVQLVGWLNGLPDVQRFIEKHCPGRPITDGNVSQWKQGGFLDWKSHQEDRDFARAIAEEDDQIANQIGIMPLSDRLSTVVSLGLGRRLRELASGPLDDPTRHEMFMDLLRQLARLRRHDHNAARLRMELVEYEKSCGASRRRFTEVPAEALG